MHRNRRSGCGWPRWCWIISITTILRSQQHRSIHRDCATATSGWPEISARKLGKEDELKKRPEFLPKYRDMLIELVHARRIELNKMRHENQFPEELIRKKEEELDLEEARLRGITLIYNRFYIVITCSLIVLAS